MIFQLILKRIDNYIDQIKEKIAEYTDQIETEIFTHREKKDVRTSSVWNVFHEIVDDSGNSIEQFYFCTKCKTVQHSARSCGSTTKLLRHPCVNPPERSVKNVNAAKFVCMDLRPFNALECSGLRELFLAGTELGKKYPTMQNKDFLEIFPSRHTVKTIITDEASRAKEAIKILFRESIKQGGLGCTLDLWSDKFKSNTYMAMTANVYLIRDDHIEQKRLVFHMGYIADIIKSKEVVKSRIVEVFRDFEVSTEEIRENVTFTTDR